MVRGDEGDFWIVANGGTGLTAGCRVSELEGTCLK